VFRCRAIVEFIDRGSVSSGLKYFRIKETISDGGAGFT